MSHRWPLSTSAQQNDEIQGRRRAHTGSYVSSSCKAQCYFGAQHSSISASAPQTTVIVLSYYSLCVCAQTPCTACVASPAVPPTVPLCSPQAERACSSRTWLGDSRQHSEWCWWPQGPPTRQMLLVRLLLACCASWQLFVHQVCAVADSCGLSPPLLPLCCWCFPTPYHSLHARGCVRTAIHTRSCASPSGEFVLGLRGPADARTTS